MTQTVRRALAVILSASAMTIVSGGLPGRAQESGKAGAEAKKKPIDPSRRVPNFFAQLGLSEEQRESIYKIQARHQPRIDELQRQIDDLRARALKECEAVLTDAQKKMLTDRRANAAESRSKRRGPAASAKSKG